MTTAYVTGPDITTFVGKGATPNADDVAWAAKCAADINAGIALRLDGETPSADGVSELTVAALIDGAALFNSRAAPHGVLSLGIDGEAVRLGADSLRAVSKVITRVHSTAGYGIG